jgi:HKD family nuclease
MEVKFIAQPQGMVQLGPLLFTAIDRALTVPTNVTIVSAFASLVTVFRFKTPLRELHEAGAKIRLVIGVDMGGTSKEVLRELASWPCEVFVFKNKRPGITFHPKIYLVERHNSAELFVGSNNLTDGGLFRNYEGAAHIRYKLPEDAAAFTSAKSELAKFLNPQAPVGTLLNAAYLKKLEARGDIPSDAELRDRRKLTRSGSPGTVSEDDTFGFEATPRPAPLPIEYQRVVLAANTHQMEHETKERKKGFKKTAKKKEPVILSVKPLAQLVAPTSFYMELNTTKGTKAEAGGKSNIPGEQRVPLEAVWSAMDFWGWPENYKKDVNPRKGGNLAAPKAKKSEDRVYFNWRPIWHISQVGNPARIVQKTVRMYYYENSSDFRFTSGDIKRWGDKGDIVKITRGDEGPVDFVCELAKTGTPEHAAWKAFCINAGRSKRGYGFS